MCCAVQAFKDGDVRFLICTDVAARGIDISGLPYVINMTLPDKSEDYIHRCGCVRARVWWRRQAQGPRGWGLGLRLQAFKASC
jgi:hypothetical protein